MSVSLGPNGLAQSGGIAMPLINKDHNASTNVVSGTSENSAWQTLFSSNYTPNAAGNLLKITIFMSCGVANSGSSNYRYGALGTAVSVNNSIISTLGRSENTKNYYGNRIWFRHDNSSGSSNTHEATFREPTVAYYTSVSTSSISIEALYRPTDFTGTNHWNFGYHSWRRNKSEILVEEFGQ
jgi:hypothetical protein